MLNSEVSLGNSIANHNLCLLLECHLLYYHVTQGSDLSYFSWVKEWTFSASQSDIHSRKGGNACVFIAFLKGNLSFEWNLTWPTGDLLPESWKGALHEAMIKGNQIHDDLFDNEATNVTVVKADSLVGDECGYNHFNRKLIYLALPQSISWATGWCKRPKTSESHVCDSCRWMSIPASFKWESVCLNWWLEQTWQQKTHYCMLSNGSC